jgi:superfamily II DNA or RNA helicase
VEEQYKKHTKGLAHALPLDEALQLSQELSMDIQLYRHCEYQAAIAASIVSQEKQFVIAIAPTGSGKTWV